MLSSSSAEGKKASGRIGNEPVEHQVGRIERIDEHIGRTNGIALVDPVVDAVQLTEAFGPSRPLRRVQVD